MQKSYSQILNEARDNVHFANTLARKLPLYVEDAIYNGLDFITLDDDSIEVILNETKIIGKPDKIAINSWKPLRGKARMAARRLLEIGANCYAARVGDQYRLRIKLIPEVPSIIERTSVPLLLKTKTVATPTTPTMPTMPTTPSAPPSSGGGFIGSKHLLTKIDKPAAPNETARIFNMSPSRVNKVTKLVGDVIEATRKDSDRAKSKSKNTLAGLYHLKMNKVHATVEVRDNGTARVFRGSVAKIPTAKTTVAIRKLYATWRKNGTLSSKSRFIMDADFKSLTQAALMITGPNSPYPSPWKRIDSISTAPIAVKALPAGSVTNNLK